MKPLYLELKAFGPYHHVQTIDFRPLARDGLFLIHGKTGAGKSTILDALLFLLYGSAGYGEKHLSMLRSQFAADSEDCVLRLDFCLGFRQFRVRRIIRIHVTRAGEKELRDTVFLGERPEACPDPYNPDESDSRYQALGNGNKSESNEILKRLTGLSSEQFQRVILLPQGRFRELLVANAQEKEEILASLFGTGRFARLVELAKARSDAANQAWGGLANRRRELLAGLGQQDLAGVQAALEASNAESARLRAAQLAARQGENTAVKALEAAQALSEAHHKLEVDSQELAAVRASLPQLDARSATLKRQRELRGIIPLLEACRRQSTALERQRQERAQCRAALPALQNAAEAGTKALAEAEARQLALEPEQRAREQELRAGLERARRLESLQQRRTSLLQTLPASQAAVESARQSLTSHDALRLEYDKIRSRYLESKSLVEALRLLYRECQSLLGSQSTAQTEGQKLQELTRRQAELEAARPALDQEISTLREAITAAESADQRRWLHEIAVTLPPGSPCPLCGSTEHPAPAPRVENPAGTQPDRRALDALVARQARLENELEHCSREYQELTRRIEGLHSELAKQSAEFHSRLDAQLARMASIGADDIGLPWSATSTLEQILEGITALGRSLDQRHPDPGPAPQPAKADELRDKLERATREHSAQEQALSSIDNEMAELHAQGEPGDARDVQRQLTALEAAREQERQELNRLRQTASQSRNALVETESRIPPLESAIATLEHDLRLATADRDAALARAGLAGPEAMPATLPTDQELDDAEAGITRQRTTHALLEAEVKRLEAVCANQPVPDLPALEARLASYRDELAQADTALSQAIGLQNQLSTGYETLKSIDEESAQSERMMTELQSLTAVLSGNNERRVSLQRYALGIYLDDVLVQANQRLAMMTEGRYQLERLEEGSDRRSAAGLDLAVSDEFTGATRPVRSLSGGESFMAALSLALGLSDVVQASSGGRKLDTLFIDEGFGSLDEESLQGAMAVLEHLSSGGRLLGIISHVKELQERIQSRLWIERGRQGSTIVQEDRW